MSAHARRPLLSVKPYAADGLTSPAQGEKVDERLDGNKRFEGMAVRVGQHGLKRHSSHIKRQSLRLTKLRTPVFNDWQTVTER